MICLELESTERGNCSRESSLKIESGQGHSEETLDDLGGARMAGANTPTGRIEQDRGKHIFDFSVLAKAYQGIDYIDTLYAW